MSNKINFSDRNWVVYGTSGCPLFMTPFAVVPTKIFFERYGISNDAVAIWKGKNFEWLYDGDQLTMLSEKMLSYLLKKKHEYVSNWKSIAKKFKEMHLELMDSDLSKHSDKELIDKAQEYYSLFEEEFFSNNLVEPLSYYLQNNLKKMLVKTGLSPEQIKQMEEAFSFSTEDNYLKKCAKEYSQAKNDKEKIKALIDKYHYIRNDYSQTREVTEEDIKEMCEGLGEVKNEKKIKAPNNESQEILELLQTAITIQDVRKEYSLMWVSGAVRIAKEVSKRKNIAYENLVFATWHEMIKQELDEKNLEERRKACVFLWTADKIDIYVGEEAEQITKDYNEIVLKQESGDEIKGITASKGKVKGRVKIVLNVSNFNKMKKGNILVAMMTRPEYLPVMKIASAIVTDEGGITCHAAIVSRELRIPCIIGTKNATKILKDGDMVEVDADNGVIKRIK